MPEFVDQEFISVVDRGGLIAEDFSFQNCQFVNCGFSLTDDISQRSHIKSIRISDSHVCDGHLGPGVIENLTVDGLSTDDTTTCFGTLFRHVIFQGKIGKLSICPEAASWNLPVGVQPQFDEERIKFYSSTDWALDISEAHFDELDIVGIPANVIRIDPSRHFILKRNNALSAGWRNRVGPNSEYWVYVIDQFLNDRDMSTVLVVPECVSKKEQRARTDGLLELRDLGVVS